MHVRHPPVTSLAALALGAAAQPGLAATRTYYVGGYDANGVPKTLVDFSKRIPADLLDEIYTRLPESRDIRKNDPKLISWHGLELPHQASLRSPEIDHLLIYSSEGGSKPTRSRDRREHHHRAGMSRPNGLA